jgi:O-antigen/teichoic acid export membrane protein
MAVLFRVFPRRLFVNTAAVFGGEAVSRLATLLMAIVIARHFGPVALGQYGYALACGSILLLVPDFGLHLYMVRDLSADHERLRAVFWSVHWLKFILGGALLLFILCFGQWGVPEGGRRVLFYVLAGRAVLQTFSQVCMAVFKAYEKMHFIALQQTLNSALALAWIGGALLFRASLTAVVIGFVVGQAAETCLGWRLVWVNCSPGRPYRWDPEIIKTILVASVPIGVTAILQALNLRIDILILGFYVTDWTLGHFQAAAWFPVGIFLVASLLMTVLFPKLSRLLRHGSAQGSAYVLGLVKNGLLLTGLGGLAVWFAAPTLLAWLLGRDSASGISWLRILAPMLPLVFLNTLLFYVFVAAQRPSVCLITLGVGMVLGLVLSFSLTSAYGATGCAIADVVREFIISGIYLCFLVQEEHARSAALGLLQVLAGATVLIALGPVLITSIHGGDRWLVAWMLFMLAGIVVVLGLPRRREWRLLTDDSI